MLTQAVLKTVHCSMHIYGYTLLYTCNISFQISSQKQNYQRHIQETMVC